MQRSKLATFLLILIFTGSSFGQQISTDTLRLKDSIDSVREKKIAKRINALKLDTTTQMLKKNDPMRAVWMGAIIPGYGQIMNKKYWKLPILYGGFLGCAYAISWNSSHYNSYRLAYRDITDNDPNTNHFLELLPPGYTIDSPGVGGVSILTNTLKSKQDNFRRYRDLSIIVSIGCYALGLIDAYVDAQLSDFDISPDLSLRIQPTILENTNGFNNKTLGLQCSFNLK